MKFVKLDFTSNARCPHCSKSGFKKGDWYVEVNPSAFRGNITFKKMHIDCWMDANKEALMNFKWVAPKTRRRLKAYVVGEHI